MLDNVRMGVKPLKSSLYTLYRINTCTNTSVSVGIYDQIIMYTVMPHPVGCCGAQWVVRRLACLCSGQFRGQKIRGPLEKPPEIVDYVFCLHKKITPSSALLESAVHR